jgi:tetratricopeptide (TPR) repeat protein
MSPLPSQIGPYEILGVLGRGGMGVVYRALQREPLRRDVALKTVAVGLDAEKILQRFEAERQVLARMSHPGIANVYDAGVTEEGEPYFAMEYVDGASLLEYCDARNLDVEDRLLLFIQTCRAVHHAHLKGIIHRDLKPGNVLVTEVDGEPVCKLIDFGIAKAVEGTGQERLTMADEVVGTPAYMSPEQIAGDEDIDTRADVYGLGAILYELLTGVLPHPDEWYRGWAAVVQTLTEDAPPVTTRLRGLGDQLELVAASRSTTPMELSRRLRGDVEWIVARALERDRDLRYDSPGDLADDLERHLRYDPVEAGPPTTWYRTRKFVRRNRAAVGASAAVMVALVAGMVSTSLALTRAQRAEQERAVEAATANRVSDFLVDLFDASNPFVARGEEPTARDLLDLGADRVRQELAGEPLIQERLMRTLASAYAGLGYEDREGQLWNDAAALLRDSLGPDPRTALAIARAADYNWRQGQEGSNATAEFEEAHRMMEDLRTVGDSLWMTTFYYLLRHYDYAGLTARTDSLATAAVARAESTLSSDDPRLADVLTTVAFRDPGWGSEDLADHRRAEEWFQRGIRIHEGAGRLEEAVNERESLAMAYINAGRHTDAVEAFRPALRWYEGRSDETEEQKVERAEFYGILAFAEERADLIDDAVHHYRRTIEVYDSVGRASDPGLEDIFLNLSGLYDRAGRTRDEIELAQEYIDRMSPGLPTGHRELLFRMVQIADGEEKLGNLPVADSVFAARVGDAMVFRDESGYDDGAVRDALRLFAEFLVRHPERGDPAERTLEAAGTEPLDRALALHQAGNALSSANRPAEAAQAYRRARTIREDVLGPVHPDVAALVHNLALTEFQQGRLEAAVAGYRQAVSLMRESLDPMTPRALTSLTNLAGLHRRMGDSRAALDTWGEVQRVRTAAWGVDHPEVAGAMVEQAYIHLALGRADRAHPMLEEARTALVAAGRRWEQNVAWTDVALAQVEATRGDLESAVLRVRAAGGIWSEWDAAPQEALARLLEGEWLLQLGREAEARDAFDRSLELYAREAGPDAPDRYWVWIPWREARASAERVAVAAPSQPSP